MKLEVENSNGVYTVKASGCLDTAAAAEFAKAVDAIPSDIGKVQFDFSDLEFIASSALRAMVTLGKRLASSGGAIEVTGANEFVRDVFEMTGLVEVFTIR